MSSLRVRAQNKLLNKLGAAKPSKNVQFDAAYANFDKTHACVSALDAALRGFIISLKSYHISAQVLYGAIESMGGTPENSTEMKQTVAQVKNAFVHVDVNALNESVKKFETRVLRPTSGWVGRATALKAQVAEFQEEKLVYDHYTRKVMALREARDKRASQGKSEKPKDVEKLVRNEQKLAAKTNSYAKSSEATVSNLREFVNAREATLAPIVQRVLEFRAQYATRIAEESKLFQQMVTQDSSFDTVLGALESFVSQFTGVGPESKHTTDQQHHHNDSTASQVVVAVVASSQEPEPPVKALSFESFTGEAPPTAVAVAVASVASAPDMPALPHPHAKTTDYHQYNQSQYNQSQNQSQSYATSPTNSGGNAFFDDFAPPPPPPLSLSPSASYHTAPVQPLPSTSAGFTPWDDISPPPPPPISVSMDKHASMGYTPTSPSAFSTMPASPTTATTGFGWDAFGDMNGSGGK